MLWVAGAAAVVSTVGNISAGNAAKRAGLEQQNEANYEAAQERVNAGQAIAASQRAAEEQRRQGDLVQSRAIALLAASGGGVTDPSAVTLLASNAGETAYRSAVALYEGEDKARTMRAQATATEMGGRAAAQAGRDRQIASLFQAAGSLANGASMFSNYGGGGFASQAPAPVYDRSPTLTGNG